MKIFKYGKRVETISGKYLGVITAAIIRNTHVLYEISYFTMSGVYEKAVLTEKEFKVIGDEERVDIGFKNKQLP